MENQILLSQLDPASLKELIRDTVSEVFNNRAPEPTEVKYLTRLQVCDLLKISLPTLHGYVHEGKIKGHRIGRRVLFSESDIHDAVKEIPNLKYSRRR